MGHTEHVRRFSIRTIPSLLRPLFAVAGALALSPGVAHACGGFFCNLDEPVDQAGETIVFEVDEQENTVTMHVEVEYEGPSESFAWVVPVKGEPDLFISAEVLFDRLRDLTRPSYGVRYQDDGCESVRGWDENDAAFSAGDDDDSTASTGGYPAGGVDVLASGAVGAYETVTLSAESSESLVTWLQMNEFDVPSSLADNLAPYVAGGMNFVALKLAKDKDVGDMSPLGLRYEGTTPVVPLTLTAVAATPDMPLTVMLLGPARGVPLNYLHVGLNPLAIDYWSGGSNIEDVIARGADEAGGQGFATEYALPLQAEGLVYREGQLDLAMLEDATDAADFVQLLQEAGFSGNAELLGVLMNVVPVPEGFPGEPSDFYNNPWSYGEWYALVEFDLDEAIAAVDEGIVTPLQKAQEMLDRSAYLTRLRSSISPEEMTLDPFFSFNPDLAPQSPSSEVTVQRRCGPGIGADAYEVPQRLVYPEGQTMMIPSQADLDAKGMTPFEYVQEYSDFAALYIQQMSTSGEPEMLSDRSDQALPQDLDSEGAEASGCGCNSSSAGWGWAALLGAAATMVRRRR